MVVGKDGHVALSGRVLEEGVFSRREDGDEDSVELLSPVAGGPSRLFSPSPLP